MATGASTRALREVDGAPPDTLELDRMNDDARNVRFRRLVEAHYELVWRTSRRLGVPSADLDDAVQEAFLSAARNLDAIEDERGYLIRACVFVATNVRRTLRRRREIVDGDRIDVQADSAARPDQTAEASEARERLQRILDLMPEELSSIFVLFELERFTMSEIADLTGLPPGTVASRLRRARKQFVSLGARILRIQRNGTIR
jgi:RNA polymerase sigma-70 factor (ECF subfamily)